MFKNKSPQNHSASMPQFFSRLLSILANPAYRDELIGDIEEEYKERQRTNKNAGEWLLRQTALAIWDGQKAMVKSTNFLKVLSIILCILAMPSIALFVGWLSNMEQPSEQLWQFLLAGELDNILLHSNYWKEAWNESGIAHLKLSMFVNIPSLLWAVVFASAAYMLLRKFTPSAWIFSALSLAYLLLPYLFGYMVINLSDPAAHRVGPILAFMILAPFFTLPMYVYFLFRRFPK